MKKKAQVRQLPSVTDNCVNTEELAYILGLGIEAIRQWRARKQGPPYFKIGRQCWYHKDELRAWLKTNSYGSVASIGALTDF